MTPDKHQMERMRAWIHVAAHTDTDNADYMLAAFDKRFPAPTAVEVAPPFNRYSEGYSDGARAARSGIPNETELAALREKARLWDAVTSGKVRLVRDEDATNSILWGAVYNNSHSTDWYISAAGAVQAAIDAGALK